MKSDIPREPSDQYEVCEEIARGGGELTDVRKKRVVENDGINGDQDKDLEALQSEQKHLEEQNGSLTDEYYQDISLDSDSHLSSESSSKARHLYNDVNFEPEHLNVIEPPEFSIQDVKEVQDTTEQSIEPFVATEDIDLLQQAIETIPPIQVIPKLTAIEDDVRYEPQLNGDPSLFNEHFSATPDTEEVVNSEGHSAVTKELSPKKRVRGSKLGMGWFQGFSLFIALLVFIALATFAYFMLGDKPLYDGDIPKYVVVGNEESGAMAALNPALPEALREQYIYVPKVERTKSTAIAQERPILDQQKETKVTKIELASSNDGTENVIISEEEISTNGLSDSSLELLSIDHDEVSFSSEDIALVESFILQGDIAYQQGFYVGTHQDDAYHYYQSALAIDPYNVQALQGIANIAHTYYVNARNAYNHGNYDIAAQYAALGLAVQPDHSALLQLQQLIEQIIATQHPSMGTGFTYESFNFNF